MTRKIEESHGIDFSKHNFKKNNTFILPEDTPYPVDFMIQRVSYSGRVDEKYEMLTDAINQCSIRGAYHYYGSGTEWKEQADLILELTQNSPARTKYHSIWLDYEGHGSWNRLTRTTAGDAHRIINYVDQNTPREVKVGLYTNASHMLDHLEPYGDWMERFPLWLAQYWFFVSPKKKPGWGVGRRKMKYPYNTQIFWQYTEHGKGSAYGYDSGYVDLNVSTKTPVELKSWLSITEEDNDNLDTTTIPEVEDTIADIVLDKIRVREETNKIKNSITEIERIIDV